MYNKYIVIITAENKEKYIANTIFSCLKNYSKKNLKILVTYTNLKNEKIIKNKFKNYKNIIFINSLLKKNNPIHDQLDKIKRTVKFIKNEWVLLLDGGSDDDNLITLIGNYIFTKLGNIFFSLKITDILFTYVLGKTLSFNNLALKSKDFTLCVEFPIKANRNQCVLANIPSYERSRIGGKKKVNAFKDGMLILLKMIKMFFIK